MTSVNRGPIFDFRRSTLEFCLGGQRSFQLCLSLVLSHTKCLKSCGRSQFPHKSFNLLVLSVMVNDVND